MGCRASKLAGSAGLGKEATALGLPDGVKKELQLEEKTTPTETAAALPKKDNNVAKETEDERAVREAYEAAVAEAKKVPLPEGSTWHEYGGAELEPLLTFTVLVCERWAGSSSLPRAR
eukprot:3018783-Prymnesium_polylepis.1